MTQREKKSMTLLKQIFDAYYDIPISIRAQLNGMLIDEAVWEAKKHLNEYKTEIRGEIEQAIAHSNINQRFK